MNSPATAASTPAALPRPRLHWNRWSVFFSLMGLTILIPSFFVPSMLVANALEGPRLFSVWTGIRELRHTDHAFLAGLILVFSVVFPLLKLAVSLLCASGASWLPRGKRRLLVYIASWTAKYSMLDVLVIAMLVMLVKVGDYVRCIACRGIYMFTFAIVCSAAAGAMLEFGLRQESSAPPVSRKRWKWHALLLLCGSTAAAWAWSSARLESGGDIENIHMSRLTKRGALKRSIEKTFALQDITKKGHDFFTRDTWTKMVEFSQTLSTDAGWAKPEAYLILHLKDGSTMETRRIKDANFDDDTMVMDFPMPKTVAWNDLESMKLISNVVYTKYMNAAVEEENVRTDTETYSLWTREWHGRIFTFELQGPRGNGFLPSLVLLAAGALAAFTGCSGLLAGIRRKGLPAIPEVSPQAP